MFQPSPEAAQVHAEAGHAAAEGAAEGFNAGTVIIEHVSNSSLEHPLIHLPKVLGIDFSVTKHVFMLWLVAAILFFGITWVVRRYIRQERLIPRGFMGVLEIGVEFIRDSIVLPNVGQKWVKTWTPLLLTLFLFILGANLIGLIPIFDVLALLNHTVIHAPEDSFFAQMLHGGVTATGNFNVTAALATVTFFTIIVAGSRAHGFVKHWTNMIPSGMPWPLYILLIPIEVMGMFIRPFALTMRLAANMTGGHIAILAILSFVFIFNDMIGSLGATGIGLVFSVPLAVGISGLEVIVVLVQAYVFTLLTAVFVGMAIHAHH
ncbi:MAG: F0F1 ATP synthase subunit A [Vicinamibacterales bacterium]